MLETLGLTVMFSTLVLHVLLDPGLRARYLLERLLLLSFLMVALPAIVLLAGLVVRVLFGRGKRDEPRVFWRSVIAVTLGVATCWAAILLFSLALAAAPDASWRWLATVWIAFPALLSGLLACFVAGWVTARFAPGSPFRHALGVGLVLALPFLPGLLISGWQVLVLAALLGLAQASMLGLGAWLRARSAPPGGTPAPAPDGEGNRAPDPQRDVDRPPRGSAGA
jgi:hypothetical protein